MDSSIINEINLLEANKSKIDGSLVYDLMIHSIKGKYVCEEERKQFVLNRVISVDKLHPRFIEPHAKSFVDCYSKMVEKTKSSECQDQYKKIFECLVDNHSKNYDFPVKCVPQMEDFINC
jgi:hypothetical protein